MDLNFLFWLLPIFSWLLTLILSIKENQLKLFSIILTLSLFQLLINPFADSLMSDLGAFGHLSSYLFKAAIAAYVSNILIACILFVRSNKKVFQANFIGQILLFPLFLWIVYYDINSHQIMTQTLIFYLISFLSQIILLFIPHRRNKKHKESIGK